MNQKRREAKLRRHLGEIESELVWIEQQPLREPHHIARRDMRMQFLEHARRELRCELDDKSGVMVLPFD